MHLNYCPYPFLSNTIAYHFFFLIQFYPFLFLSCIKMYGTLYVSIVFKLRLFNESLKGEIQDFETWNEVEP